MGGDAPFEHVEMDEDERDERDEHDEHVVM